MKSRMMLTGLIPTLALGLTACTGGGFGVSGDALNVSGLLSTGNSSQSLEVQSAGIPDDDISTMSVNLTQYKVSCSTQSTPVQTATSSVGADGSFNVSIPGAVGQPLSCALLDSNGDKAADFLISDSSKKDLNGNNQSSSTASFKSNANLGSISFDPNAGEVTVPAANIAAAVAPVTATAASVYDPSGAWTISTITDFTLPKGVKAPCANHNNCDGPPDGQGLYLKLWKGTQISDSSDVYGLQVWQGQSSFATCGSKIGLTTAAKTALGIDLSANGSADDVFTFNSSVPNFLDQITNQTSTVTLTNGWQMSTAKTQWSINPNCAPHDVTIGGILYSNAWICGPDNSGYYSASLGGGCVDSTGSPVILQDWSSINNNCQNAIDGNGVRTNTCAGTASISNQSKTVTCSNKWAVVTQSSGNYTAVTSNSVNFNWSDLSAAQIPSGTSCSDTSKFTGATEALKIAQLQCYSQYYYQSGMENANACLPRVDTDWSATTAANFAIVDKMRPSNLVFFEMYKPFADGTGGTLLTRQEHYEGVNVEGNNWVNCRVIETGGLNIKKLSSTKLLATYQSSLITTSTSKPACLAAFTGSRQTYMFYLTK